MITSFQSRGPSSSSTIPDTSTSSQPKRPSQKCSSDSSTTAETNRSIQAGLVDWTVQLPLPRDGRVVAAAVDEAGNREVLAHTVVVKD